MWFFKKAVEKAPDRALVAVRMEAIGGQGANSAGKILAEAAVLGMGYKGNHFSSFGSEKRGTPVRSFARFSTQGQTIRSASFIDHPDLLMIFHESLMETHQEVLHGITVDTDLLINSEKAPNKLNIPVIEEAHSVSTVPGTRLAQEIGCGLNVVMLGAAVGLYQEIAEDKVLGAIETFFKKLPPASMKKNIEGFHAGKKHVEMARFQRSEDQTSAPVSSLPPMGWSNAPLGGVIINPGNTVLKDHSVSRKGYAPRLIKEVCFHCGYCDAVCPDFCFVWKPDEQGVAKLQGIDYQYCKACQKCVEVCPASALEYIPESKISEDEKLSQDFMQKLLLKKDSSR